MFQCALASVPLKSIMLKPTAAKGQTGLEPKNKKANPRQLRPNKDGLNKAWEETQPKPDKKPTMAGALASKNQ